MFSRLQFANMTTVSHVRPCWMRSTLAMVLWLGCAAFASGRQTLPGAIGSVEGNDVTVEGGVTSNGGAANASRIVVMSGSVVTVHSGQARMTLAGGGEIEICGPAKLTVLQAGDAITVALNFGQIHILLPGATALRIFTPTVIATPLDIGGAARDVTMGLSLDDSLCILATSGALQLEQQFSGDKLIVPQAGEFSLAAGKLQPVASIGGSCRCVVLQTRAVPAPPPSPVPDTRLSSAMPIAPFVTAAPVPSVPPMQPAAPDRSVEYSALARSTDARPSETSKRVREPALATDVPIYTVVAPPLTFSAANPNLPPEPEPNLVLLIRTAQVQPDWEFTGRVGSPEFIVAMQYALGDRKGPPKNLPKPPSPPTKNSGGFWHSLKKIFGGS